MSNITFPKTNSRNGLTSFFSDSPVVEKQDLDLLDIDVNLKFDENNHGLGKAQTGSGAQATCFMGSCNAMCSRTCSSTCPSCRTVDDEDKLSDIELR